MHTHAHTHAHTQPIHAHALTHTRALTPTISFLRMELDTVVLEIRLPAEKLERLRAELGKWRGKKSMQKEVPPLFNRHSIPCLQSSKGQKIIPLATH